MKFLFYIPYIYEYEKKEAKNSPKNKHKQNALLYVKEFSFFLFL